MADGKIAADIVKHAYMLLHSDRDMSDVAIAAFLMYSEDTMWRTRVRYLTEGSETALEVQPHPGPDRPSMHSKKHT